MVKSGQQSNREEASRGGWLRLHRKLRDNPRYRDSEAVHLWIHFLLSAEFQPRSAVFQGKVVKLAPGQFISSRRELSLATGICQAKIIRIIEQLKSDQQIEQRAGSKHSMFTVRNWRDYQKTDRRNDQPADSDRSATDQPSIHEKRNRQAGVRGNGAKKQRSLEAKNGGGWILSGEKANAAPGGLVPKFAPLSLTLFPDEYEKLKAEAERQIERLKAAPENWERSQELRAEIKADRRWLEDLAKERTHDAEKIGNEIAALVAAPTSYEALRLVPEAREAVKVWRERIKAIESALSGRVS